MATPSKNKFINVELSWAKDQLATWKNYVDANPFEIMIDRLSYKETKNGGIIPTIVASIEAQQKNIRETIKDYLLLLEVVKKLEFDEEQESNRRKGFDGEDVL